MSFCNLDVWINKNIKSLQYKEPTEIQKLAIPHILGNKGDLIGISKTGSGKTASFCLSFRLLRYFSSSFVSMYRTITCNLPFLVFHSEIYSSLTVHYIMAMINVYGFGCFGFVKPFFKNFKNYNVKFSLFTQK